MGREIELKIQLSQDEFEFAHKNFILSSSYNDVNFHKQNKNLITKTDEYYSLYESRKERIQNNEPSAIRLRVERTNTTTNTFFTIKQRTCKNGIEFNQENETKIENPEVLRQFFKLTGYKIWFKKEKSTYSCFCNFKGIEFHIELVKVNSLSYVEIEATGEKATSSIISTTLERLAKQLGFDTAKKDSRSWVQILEENDRKCKRRKGTII